MSYTVLTNIIAYIVFTVNCIYTFLDEAKGSYQKNIKYEVLILNVGQQDHEERNMQNKMQEALQGVRKAFSINDNKIGILYSGGKDSSSVLLAIAKEFPDAELYLYALNNGCMYPDEIKERIEEKLELFVSKGLVKNKMKAVYFDVRDIMAYLGFKSFHDDVHTYPTGLLCCSCKLSMHFVTAKYSSQIGVQKIADGYSFFERFLPEQLPEFRNAIFNPVRDRYGVEIVSPLYNVFDAVDVPMNILQGFGLDPDIFLGEKSGQAMCLLGLIYKIPYEINDPDELKNAFFDELKNAVRDYTAKRVEWINGIQKVKRHDSYGNDYFEDISYDRLMEKIIANKETFFEN